MFQATHRDKVEIDRLSKEGVRYGRGLPQEYSKLYLTSNGQELGRS